MRGWPKCRAISRSSSAGYLLRHQLGSRDLGLALVAGHGAAALEEGAVLDHQRWRVDIGKELAPGGNLDLLRGTDRTLDRAGDENLTHPQVSLHLAALAYDQVARGVDLARELAIHAEGGLETELPLHVAAGIEEAVEVILLAAAVGLEFHCTSPRSTSTS